MSDKVYHLLQLVGSSSVSIETAIENALAEALTTVSKVDWFEVVETRGFVEGAKVKYYQVKLDVGCVK